MASRQRITPRDSGGAFSLAGRMVAMNRLLTIAKYLPAVLCGLLVVAWVVSIYVRIGGSFSIGERAVHLCVFDGTFAIAVHDGDSASPLNVTNVPSSFGYLGHVLDPWHHSRIPFSMTFIPISLAITSLVPFGAGPFIRFRFPLWSWFAFTALIAVELRTTCVDFTSAILPLHAADRDGPGPLRARIAPGWRAGRNVDRRIGGRCEGTDLQTCFHSWRGSDFCRRHNLLLLQGAADERQAVV